MGHLLAGVHAAYVLAVFRVNLVEAAVHLLLGAEGLYDAQSAKRLLHLAHRVAPQRLRLYRLLLQLAAHKAHEPAHDGHYDEREERQLPADDEQRGKIEHYQYRVLEEHVEARHYGVLNLLHVAAHARYDVALALLGEESERQRRNLAVELVAYVAHHACAYRNYRSRRKEIGTRLQKRHEGQKQAYDEQRCGGAHAPDHLVDIIIGVVYQHIFHVAAAPVHQSGRHAGRLSLEKYLQDWYYGHERKDVQYRRKDIKHHRQYQVFFCREVQNGAILVKILSSIRGLFFLWNLGLFRLQR